MTVEPTEYTAALIELHRGLERQGPGDVDFARELLRGLPALPAKPRIADLGCGSGSGALVLASHFGAPVRAVDTCQEFLDELIVTAQQAGVADLIEPIRADMGALGWAPGSLDLLWSEGAAYNLGFEKALGLWRPLLAKDGLAVISEMSWFTPQRPARAVEFWTAAYAGMGSEPENVARAIRAGFEVLETRRLPARYWWRNYYEPLRERMRQIERTPAMQAVIADTETEMRLFEQFAEAYGYTFYLMQVPSDAGVS